MLIVSICRESALISWSNRPYKLSKAYKLYAKNL